jgi:lipoprotein-anchoring transpeptidase ErfK/SrfK
MTSIALSSCSTTSDSYTYSSGASTYTSYASSDVSTRLASNISSPGKVVVIDPSVHAWGAYENGELVRAGLATAGSSWCPDIGRPCRTKIGHFRVNSLGSAECKSSKYPIPKGGAPMPYCMFFNGNQGMHGSNEVVEANISHGCVRMHTADAEWLRFNFVKVGTPVIVRPY